MPARNRSLLHKASSAVNCAVAAAARGEGLLIQDTGTDANDMVVIDVMDGYALLARELVDQFSDAVGDRPGHLFVQAGVGGLAAALADGLRDFMQEPRRILIVEPESAACVGLALAEGRPIRVRGDLRTSAGICRAVVRRPQRWQSFNGIARNRSSLGKINCKMQSECCARQAAPKRRLPERQGSLASRSRCEPALRASHRLDPDSSVLLVVTEGSAAD